MRRWLGIDWGTRRVGIAAGSVRDGIASPLEVIPAEPKDRVLARVMELAREYDAEGVVVGWPLNMDDTEGPQGRLTREIAAELAVVTGLDVRLWDERLSSFEADKALAGLLTRKKKKQRQDAVAAASMLKDFLSSDGPRTARRPRDFPG
jgi:putative Holliday junction resolvase